MGKQHPRIEAFQGAVDDAINALYRNKVIRNKQEEQECRMAIDIAVLQRSYEFANFPISALITLVEALTSALSDAEVQAKLEEQRKEKKGKKAEIAELFQPIVTSALIAIVDKYTELQGTYN